MNADDIDVVEKTTPFNGYFRVDRYRLKHRLFEGGWSGEMSREVFERGHAASVIPYDADLDKIVLIEQFRVGAFAALASPWFNEKDSPWLIELIAGIIDPGENPTEVVRREAVEEAGCTVGEIVPACRYLVTPGASSESMHIFVAQADLSNVGGIHGLSDEHENIRVMAVDAEQAFKWVDEGRIANSMALIGLYWFRQHREALRRRWRRTRSGC